MCSTRYQISLCVRNHDRCTYPDEPHRPRGAPGARWETRMLWPAALWGMMHRHHSRRADREAEGARLLSEYRMQILSGVRIPSSPPAHDEARPAAQARRASFLCVVDGPPSRLRHILSRRLTGPRHRGNISNCTRRYLSWIEDLTTNQGVIGSNPIRRTTQANGGSFGSRRFCVCARAADQNLAGALFSLTLLASPACLAPLTRKKMISYSYNRWIGFLKSQKLRVVCGTGCEHGTRVAGRKPRGAGRGRGTADSDPQAAHKQKRPRREAPGATSRQPQPPTAPTPRRSRPPREP